MLRLKNQRFHQCTCSNLSRISLRFSNNKSATPQLNFFRNSTQMSNCTPCVPEDADLANLRALECGDTCTLLGNFHPVLFQAVFKTCAAWWVLWICCGYGPLWRLLRASHTRKWREWSLPYSWSSKPCSFWAHVRLWPIYSNLYVFEPRASNLK